MKPEPGWVQTLRRDFHIFEHLCPEEARDCHDAEDRSEHDW